MGRGTDGGCPPAGSGLPGSRSGWTRWAGGCRRALVWKAVGRLSRCCPSRACAGPERIKPVTIRVLIADDQQMVRTGFRMIVDSQPDMEVVGEAADGADAVALAHRLRPDVCLFDIRMPNMDGLEATRLLAGPS